mgnify:CR=1 FL=1
MKLIKYIFNIIGIIVIGSFVFIGVVTFTQVSDVEEICQNHQVGGSPPNIDLIKNNYSVKVSGPLPVSGSFSKNSVIFCAPFTMCETSCDIAYNKRKVIKSHHRRG